MTIRGPIQAANIVVTCTKRKTAAVSRSLQLRNAIGATVEKRAAHWTANLAAEQVPGIPASHLYAGDQWQIANSLPKIGAKRQLLVRLWIASAGYGLVSATSMLKPYSATFSQVHPDSVRNLRGEERSTLLQRWWRSLSKWKGPDPTQPRTLAAVAQRFPNDPLLIVASSTYLLAISEDIGTARENLSNSDLLTIISAGTDKTGPLASNLLPCDGRLRTALGGSLMSLNGRIARRIIAGANGSTLSYTRLSRSFTSLLANQPELPRYDRRGLTDRQVQRYILKRLALDSRVCASPLLRQLRDDGFACEQKRFNKLYRQILDSTNA